MQYVAWSSNALTGHPWQRSRRVQRTRRKFSHRNGALRLVIIRRHRGKHAYRQLTGELSGTGINEYSHEAENKVQR